MRAKNKLPHGVAEDSSARRRASRYLLVRIQEDLNPQDFTVEELLSEFSGSRRGDISTMQVHTKSSLDMRIADGLVEAAETKGHYRVTPTAERTDDVLDDDA